MSIIPPIVAGPQSEASGQTRRRLLVVPLLILAPGHVAAAFILAGWMLELLLLTCRADHILGLDTAARTQVPVLLLLAWLILGWSLWITVRVTVRIGSHLPRRLRSVLMALLSLACTGLFAAYAASWLFYLRTGRFLNWDAMEFALVNSGESWLVSYLLRSELSMVLSFLAATVAIVFAAFSLVRWIARSAGPAVSPLSRLVLYALRVMVWTGVGYAAVATGVRRGHNATQFVRESWGTAVQQSLNPTATVLFGTLQSMLGEPIEPDLDRAALTPITDKVWEPSSQSGTRPNVVFVVIESLRHDVVGLRHQSREVMPNLSRLARNGVTFTRAYTQCTHSDYANPCILSSLYPLRSMRHHYFQRTDPWPKTLIYDLLSRAGYATAIISAMNEKWGGMDQFFETPGLGLYYDAERSGIEPAVDARDTGFAKEVGSGALRAGSLVDSHVMDVAISWIASRIVEGQPYFAHVNLHGSHFPYNIPQDCQRPFQPCAMDFEASFASYPAERAPIVRNAYFNALHECDRQLGRLIEALKVHGQLNQTIIMVMGDHGEAFHENAVVCHAGPPVEPVVHVALVLHATDLIKSAVEDYPVELVDVVPTALGLMGLQTHPNFQGIDVLAADRPPPTDRLLFFHTENPLCRSDGLLYQGRWKLIHDRVLDAWWLFDVVSDPGETRDVIAESPRNLVQRLKATLLQWRHQQLAYYQYPFYYLAYYPPRPPAVQIPTPASN